MKLIMLKDSYLKKNLLRWMKANLWSSSSLRKPPLLALLKRFLLRLYHIVVVKKTAFTEFHTTYMAFSAEPCQYFFGQRPCCMPLIAWIALRLQCLVPTDGKWRNSCSGEFVNGENLWNLFEWEITWLNLNLTEL